MNKETRTFIFWLILLFICGSAFIISIIQLKEKTNFVFFDWALLILNLNGFLIGFYKINKTTC